MIKYNEDEAKKILDRIIGLENSIHIYDRKVNFGYEMVKPRRRGYKYYGSPVQIANFRVIFTDNDGKNLGSSKPIAINQIVKKGNSYIDKIVIDLTKHIWFVFELRRKNSIEQIKKDINDKNNELRFNIIKKINEIAYNDIDNDRREKNSIRIEKYENAICNVNNIENIDSIESIEFDKHSNITIHGDKTDRWNNEFIFDPDNMSVTFDIRGMKIQSVEEAEEVYNIFKQLMIKRNNRK